MKTEILKMLREANTYLSGQELSEQLGVSRTAVWKVIRQLGEEGYEIEAVRNKGYRLVKSADVLSKEEIESCLKTQWAGRNLIYYPVTDSTNTRIQQMAEEGAVHGSVAVAGEQTAGKGRRGRSWIDPPGAGIAMSILLRPEISSENASMLTLVAALAATKAIRTLTGLDAKIKWPNDVVLSGKKAVGILTQMSTEEDAIRYVIVGIGVNVNREHFPEEIEQTATSLKLESGRTISRSSLVAEILQEFETYYARFLEKNDLSELCAEYDSWSANVGRVVRVLDPAGEYSGEALGIDSRGQLLVKCAPGEIRRVISGEVSVRGIYGYV